MLAYVNAKAKIFEYIKANKLREGDRLPTESMLAEKLNIGRLTLREGLNALKSEGIIISIQGKGTFVTCNSEHISDTLNVNYSVTDMIYAGGYTPGVSFFEKNIVVADPLIARSLHLNENTNVPLCTRVRTADNIPMVLSYDYLSPVLASIFIEFSPKDISLYNFIEQNSEQKIGTSITEITSECADDVIAKQLEVEPGIPLIIFEAIVNNHYGEPLIFSKEYFRKDKFRFIVTRGRQ